MIVPRGVTTLEVGDEVLAITDSVGEEQLAQLFTSQNSRNHHPRSLTPDSG
jgi:hypothetical protein